MGEVIGVCHEQIYKHGLYLYYEWQIEQKTDSSKCEWYMFTHAVESRML